MDVAPQLRAKEQKSFSRNRFQGYRLMVTAHYRCQGDPLEGRLVGAITGLPHTALETHR